MAAAAALTMRPVARKRPHPQQQQPDATRPAPKQPRASQQQPRGPRDPRRRPPPVTYKAKILGRSADIVPQNNGFVSLHYTNGVVKSGFYLKDNGKLFPPQLSIGAGPTSPTDWHLTRGCWTHEAVVPLTPNVPTVSRSAIIELANPSQVPPPGDLKELCLKMEQELSNAVSPRTKRKSLVAFKILCRQKSTRPVLRVYAVLDNTKPNLKMLLFFKQILGNVCPPGGLSSIKTIQGCTVPSVVNGVLNGTSVEPGFGMLMAEKKKEPLVASHVAQKIRDIRVRHQLQLDQELQTKVVQCAKKKVREATAAVTDAEGKKVKAAARMAKVKRALSTFVTNIQGLVTPASLDVTYLAALKQTLSKWTKKHNDACKELQTIKRSLTQAEKELKGILEMVEQQQSHF